jgi:hypothetical protein
MPNETKITPDDHRVFEGLKPTELEPGDLILKVDKRPDGTLCCLTVFRRTG